MSSPADPTAQGLATGSLPSMLLAPPSFIPPQTAFVRSLTAQHHRQITTQQWELESTPAFPPSPRAFVNKIPPRHSLRHQLQVNDHHSYFLPALRRTQPPRVVGHRGALYEALENTRESFLKCAEWKCQAVELDVFCLPTSRTDPAPVVIVFHGGGNDENPGDLTDYCLNQDGVSILDLTYEECLHLDFNPDHAEFACPREKIQQASIPTLQQVLEDLKGAGLEVKIELKGPGTVGPVLEVVEKLHMTSQCSYSSFDHARLKELRHLRPDLQSYPTAALFGATVPDNFVSRAVLCGATAVHLKYDTCTVERVDQVHAAGMQSMAWFRGPVGMKTDTAKKYWDVGNEDEACYQAVLDTGVDELCVNRPDVLLQLLQQTNGVTVQ